METVLRSCTDRIAAVDNYYMFELREARDKAMNQVADRMMPCFIPTNVLIIRVSNPDNIYGCIALTRA